jgi:hypothetical protein
MNASITKREAMSAINRTFQLALANSSTHFVNVNASKSVWWLDIPVQKFTSGRNETLDLLLVSDDAKTLHHLQVPTAYVRESLSMFHVREDKGCVSLELSSLPNQLFQDVRPRSERLPFASFLLNSLPLSPKRVATHG